MDELLSFDDAHATIIPGDAPRSMLVVSTLTEIAHHTEYDDPRTFINLPIDTNHGSRVEDVVRALKTEELKHIFLVGIGGSSLGLRALLPAIPVGGLQVHVIETLSGYEARRIAHIIERDIVNPQEVAVVIASKSGTTTETAANAGYIVNILEKKLGSVGARVAVVTDDGSPLAAYAVEHGYWCVPMPSAVGGRYSVFSSVGLLPFALAGGSTAELLEGAQSARETFLQKQEKSVAARLGAHLAAYAEGGYRTHNLFVFEPLLEDLGKWWRQLVGESLGKNTLTTGEPSHASIIPMVSVGSTDLHSVGQLYLSGTPGIATTFLRVESGPDPVVPYGIAGELVPGLNDLRYKTIMNAIMEGAMRAYTERNLPFLSLRIRDCSPKALGAFMQTQMIAVALAGEMLGVNAFDQPNVEDYKRITRELLSGRG